MGLSNAERQRRWREKQKEKNAEAYRQRERERKRQSYIPHSLLPPKKLEEERLKDRIKARKKYQRKKQKKTEVLTQNSERLTRSTAEKMTVKLPIFSKKSGPQKRYKTALRAAYRKISVLTAKNKELLKSKRKVQKRNERLLNQSSSTKQSNKPSAINDAHNTPRSKTKLLLKKAGLKLKANSQVHRQLLLGNTVIESLREKFSEYKKKHMAEKKLTLSVLQKYRCIHMLSKDLGIGRRKISMVQKTRASRSIKKRYGDEVISFLEREDNSIILPGKKDTKTVDKDVHQKRVLNDYLHNLFNKFKVENPDIKISRSEFCKLRPPYILLTSFASRRTCLCIYHQNFALKLKSIRSKGIRCSPNPDTFVKEFDTNEKVGDVLEQQLNQADEITYRHWKRVNVGDKCRWKELEERNLKGEFIDNVLEELTAFRSHVQRVQNQYSEMRRLRENLPENEILIWMDFAENYGCTSVEEVQSAYWNVDMISLHTMVIYSQQQVKSYVAVSDILSHNAASVYCILKRIVPILIEQHPGLKRIHYLTDSPTSQYRNKTIFQIVCHHQQDFGVSAKWNYLEVGHGKGPCDGLGASVKRSADMAVKQGKCAIQNALEFYTWATANYGSKVKYILYTIDDIKEAEEVLSKKQVPQAVPGTMKIHAVVPLTETSIATRELSCCCQDCLFDVTNTTCKGWMVRSLVKKVQPVTKGNRSQIPEGSDAAADICTTTNTLPVRTEIAVVKHDWVAAIYEKKWYLGQVTDSDDETNEVQINFLTASSKIRNSYKYPVLREEVWIKTADVLLVIKTLEASGKSRRSFNLAESDKQKIEKLFDRRKGENF